MFNDEITLIKRNTTYDKAGDKQENTTERTLLCSVRDATRREFYEYGDDENRPEFIVSLNTCEYENEKNVRFRGREYRVGRTYVLDRDTIELTLTRRISR